MSAVLDIEDLCVTLHTRRGVLQAVDHLSLSVEAGRTLALVGESGCGKSLTALSIMRLLPTPPARIASGRVSVDGMELTAMSERQVQAVRGRQVSMIFQDPMSTLNPVLTVGQQIQEVLSRHLGLRGERARRRAIELLDLVRIPDPARRLDEYPHRLSGGMCQRIVVAMAIACEPRVLIADEPTTALDVTIQAQILALLRDLQQANGMAMLLITHDLGVVAECADRVAVMYAGRKVEEASVQQLFAMPKHPYTQGLLRATPTFAHGGGRLADIPGMVPQLSELPPGCAFADRCDRVIARCRNERPAIEGVGVSDASVACFVAQTKPAGVIAART